MDNYNKMSAVELLEYIQLEYLKLNGSNVSSMSDVASLMKDFLKVILGKNDVTEEYLYIVDKYKDVVLPTKYQDPITYYMLLDIVKGIDEIKDAVLEGFPSSNTKIPLFGTVNFHVFSAEICTTKCTDKLIIISGGLFTYANLISKVVAQTFPIIGDGEFSTDINKILQHVQNTPNIKLRYFDLMMACLFTNKAPKARQYFINMNLNNLVEVIRHSFEVFIVAHEYAHSLLGHLDDKNINNTVPIETFDDLDVKQIFHNWEDEIQADLLGAALTLGVMNKKGYDSFLAMIGIIVCTNSFEQFDLINALRSKNEKDLSTTHPPGTLRQSVLIEYFFYESDVKLFPIINSILNNLWSEFVDFHNWLKGKIEEVYNVDIYNMPFREIQNILYEIFKTNFLTES